MDKLSDEILLKVLSYLSTYELAKFCVAFEKYEYLLGEKTMIGCLDFSRQFDAHSFPLYKWITGKLDHSCVKVLKINYIYWIPAEDLRRIIRKLKNLEELHALYTKLGLETKDVREYTNLKKLAISVDTFDISLSVMDKHLKSLKALCLKIAHVLKDTFKEAHLLHLFRCLLNLEELWIHTNTSFEEFRDENLNYLISSLKHLKKLVICNNATCHGDEHYFTGFVRVFECRRDLRYAIFERNDPALLEPKETEFEKACEFFKHPSMDLSVLIKNNIPFGPEDSKQLYLNTNMENIYFQELNFSNECHFQMDSLRQCSTEYRNAVLKFLISTYTSKLKKLSFNSCLLQDTQDIQRNSHPLEFKRRRKGVNTNAEKHLFQNVVQNLKSLKELKIETCVLFVTKCNQSSTISAYPAIEKLENLEKLTLHIPILLDGAFLKQVFIKCRRLEYVSLTCHQQNEKFMLGLYQSLKFATALTDFSLAHIDVKIDILLKSFNEMVVKNIRRIYIFCNNLQYCFNSPRNDVYTTFLTNNPQLLLFWVTVSDGTVKEINSIQHIFRKFQTGNPAKVFRIDKNGDSLSDYKLYIIAHHDLFLECTTSISSINLENF